MLLFTGKKKSSTFIPIYFDSYPSNINECLFCKYVRLFGVYVGETYACTLDPESMFLIDEKTQAKKRENNRERASDVKKKKKKAGKL